MSEERVPKNLQAFLKFCLQADDGKNLTDNFSKEEFDEKSKWLNNVMKEISVDIGNILIDNLNVLIKMIENKDFNINDGEQAIENLIDIVENIDYAKDFIKIGGLKVLLNILRSNSELSPKAAELLAAVTQNDETCQAIATDLEFVNILLKNINDTNNGIFVKKYVSGLSCCIRGNNKGIEQFQNHDGISVLLSSMDKGKKEARVKSIFLMCCLSEESGLLFNETQFKRLFNELTITDLDDPSLEFLCKLVKNVAKKDNKLYQKIQGKESLNWINSKINYTKGKPEYEELYSYLCELKTY